MKICVIRCFNQGVLQKIGKQRKYNKFNSHNISKPNNISKFSRDPQISTKTTSAKSNNISKYSKDQHYLQITTKSTRPGATISTSAEISRNINLKNQYQTRSKMSAEIKKRTQYINTMTLDYFPEIKIYNTK